MSIPDAYPQTYDMKLGSLHQMDHLSLSREPAFRQQARNHLDKFRFMRDDMKGKELQSLSKQFKVSLDTVVDAFKHLYGSAVATDMYDYEVSNPT